MIRLDELNIKNYKIYQDSDSFCFGTDAVLLSWFAGAKKFTQAVDLCSGNGIIPVLLSVHTCVKKITAVELQQSQSELSRRTVEYNSLGGIIDILNADLREIKPARLLENAECDLVTVNPPYMPDNTGFISEGGRGLARTELSCSLEDVLEASAYLLKNSGRLCMINRPDRLTDIFCSMRSFMLEPKRLLTVSSTEKKPPVLVLIEAVKGGKSGIVIEQPLFIHAPDGSYTERVKKIYSGDGLA